MDRGCWISPSHVLFFSARRSGLNCTLRNIVKGLPFLSKPVDHQCLKNAVNSVPGSAQGSDTVTTVCSVQITLEASVTGMVL